MDDHSIETTFEKLLNRAPSETEKVYLYRIKDALNIKDDDPMWQIFIAQGHHINFFVRLVNQLDKIRKELVQELDFKTGQLRNSAKQYAKDQAEITAKEIAAETFERYLEYFDLKITELVESARIAEENRKSLSVTDYLIVIFSVFSLSGLALFGGFWIGAKQPEVWSSLLLILGIN
ncbi:hypothetical protein [Endozoicomonas ascidiicola]|uniref:hypothetical protein n=1 Tax=Endozoicomonas ascidiicola TaxID=1698521 RepID=UPI0008335087|nr:hypothetical protein [Endozoicomonas ascidiicola]